MTQPDLARVQIITVKDKEEVNRAAPLPSICKLEYLSSDARESPAKDAIRESNLHPVQRLSSRGLFRLGISGRISCDPLSS